MIDLTPEPIAIHLGPLPIYWYGICYALGLFAAYQIMVREARRKGLDSEIIINGLIIVAIAALIGGRLYHVVDQWVLYKDDPITILLPIHRLADGSYYFAGFSGLGVYGGLITGTLAALAYIRWKGQSFWRWADVVAPALFLMQALGRFGNFFNQELYGPPTNLPWGLAIQCKNRVAIYACPAGSDPVATLGDHFHPLFLYESLSGLLGALFVLWLGRRHSDRLRPGDLLLIFFIWYSTTRFLLEFLRAGYNWNVGGIPTAQLFAGAAIVGASAILLIRHLRGGPSVARIEAAEAAERAERAAATSPQGSGEPVAPEPAPTEPEGVSTAPEPAPTEPVEPRATGPDEPPRSDESSPPEGG